MTTITKVYRTDGGDRLVVEVGGTVQVKAGGRIVTDDGTQAAAIADVSGGTTIDAEARTALNAVLSALRGVGIVAT